MKLSKRIGITEQLNQLGIPIKKYSAIALLGMLLIIATGITNILLISVISETLQSGNVQASITPLSFISVLLIAFLLSVAAQWILGDVGHQIVYQINKNILKRIIQAEPEYFHTLEKSKVYNTFSQDIPAMLRGIQIIPYTLYGISLIFSGLCYMLWLSWGLALTIIIALVVIIYLCNIIISWADQKHQRNRKIQDSLVSTYSDIIYGHKELALNEARGHDVFDKVISGDALESKKLHISGDRLISISSQIMGILPLGLVGVVLWAGSFWAGDYMLIAINFAVVLMFIRQPIGNLIHQVEALLYTRIAFKHLNNLALPPCHNLPAAVELSKKWKAIRMKKVMYKYANNDNFSLGPIDLQINRGEITFLVGSNGAGKTTLLNILCGLSTPSHGEVFVDDDKINHDNRRQYRAMFSAVLSDFFLFDNTLTKDENVNGDHLMTFIKRLELENVLSMNEGKMDTVSLSTGQKKRLAMVIACMENRSVMVLDEWAADQDPRFRKVFYEEVLPKLKSEGVTLIVISHDDRYFHVADKLITLESGVICR